MPEIWRRIEMGIWLLIVTREWVFQTSGSRITAYNWVVRIHVRESKIYRRYPRYFETPFPATTISQRSISIRSSISETWDITYSKQNMIDSVQIALKATTITSNRSPISDTTTCSLSMGYLYLKNDILDDCSTRTLTFDQPAKNYSILHFQQIA